MAWDDEPTEAQINALYSYMKWGLPTEELQNRLSWLDKHSVRSEVSREIKRIGKLYEKHNLNRQTAWESDIWDGYEEQ